MNMVKQFGPGPSYLPQDILNQAYEDYRKLIGVNHRSSSVVELIEELTKMFLDYFELSNDWSVLYISGGASQVFDLLPFFFKSSHHLVNGAFSEKWYKAHLAQKHMRVTQTHMKPEQSFDEINFFQSPSDLYCLTHNETSLGIGLDLTDLQKTKHGLENSFIAVDATSAAMQMSWDKELIDCYFFSTQKVLACDGGMAIMFISPRLKDYLFKKSTDELKHVPKMLRLDEHIKVSLKSQTLNTPSVFNLCLMKASLKRFVDLGLDCVLDQSKLNALEFYKAVEKHPRLSSFVRDRSSTVACLKYDGDVQALLRKLKSQYEIEGLSGYRNMGEDLIRISLFHYLPQKDRLKLLDLID